MKQTINLSMFRDAFKQAGRSSKFSYDALEVLFDFLEDVNLDYELDVIALCCEFQEATPAEIARYYGVDMDGVDPATEDGMELILDYLNDNTLVCGLTDTSVVFQSF